MVLDLGQEHLRFSKRKRSRFDAALLNTVGRKPHMDAYLGTREAAELWGVKQSDVSRWCREGKLRGGMEVCEQDAPGKP